MFERRRVTYVQPYRTKRLRAAEAPIEAVNLTCVRGGLNAP